MFEEASNIIQLYILLLMNDDIKQYFIYVEDEYKRFGLNFNPNSIGLSVNKVQFFRETKSFSYQCISGNDIFKNIFKIESIENFRYEDFFPQQSESKFDWSVILGHAAEFYSISFFYCHSVVLSRWFKCMIIAPKKGIALISFEDITDEKNNEISENLLRYQNQ